MKYLPSLNQEPAPMKLDWYYVSVIDGSRTGLLLGPFRTHQLALNKVEQVRQHAVLLDPKAHFYGFGTCKVTQDPTTLRAGLLNKDFGLML
jgi:hypothetical protein